MPSNPNLQKLTHKHYFIVLSKQLLNCTNLLTKFSPYRLVLIHQEIQFINNRNFYNTKTNNQKTFRMQTTTSRIDCKTRLFLNAKNLLVLCLLIFSASMTTPVKAQYSNVPVTGYNCDNVLNGAGTALTSVTGGAASI